MRRILFVWLFLLVWAAGCAQQNEPIPEFPDGNQDATEVNEKVAENPSEQHDVEHSEGNENDIFTREDLDPEALGPFQKGVDLDDPPNVEDYRQIYDKFIDMVTAWAEKDREKFREAFVTESVADSHMFLLDDSQDYQFVGTPTFVDQSDDNGRIHVSFYYRDEDGETYSQWATYRKNDDGEWKLYMID